MKVHALNLVQRRKISSFLEKAKNAQRNRRWAEAYEAYSKVLGRDDSRFGILVQMGHMSKEMGNFEQAESHYTEALALRPEDWDLHVQFGHLFNKSGSLDKAREWYYRANTIKPTPEINELLHTIVDRHDATDVSELKRKTLEHMDSRRFQKALPDAVALFEIHGLRDFDVIAGHALRELGRYPEAREMYDKYFERCMLSDSRHLNDAFWQLMNILEILEEPQEILNLFARLKHYHFNKGSYSSFGSEQAGLLQSHIGKLYGVFSR